MLFSKNTQVDHNECNYIMVLAYIIRKYKTGYTGLESYIRNQYIRGEVILIPNHQAMGIKWVSESEEAQNIKKINQRQGSNFYLSKGQNFILILRYLIYLYRSYENS